MNKRSPRADSDDEEILSGTSKPELFREAMTQFASGVTIVTTADQSGRWWGFTASAFSSLSVSPPLVLVCLATSADSHPAFMDAPRFIVNILRHDQEELAVRFATKGADKFGGGHFRPGSFDGLPVLEGALVSLRCHTDSRFEGGDHTIIIGEVEYVTVRRHCRPALHYSRRFWDLLEPLT